MTKKTAARPAAKKPYSRSKRKPKKSASGPFRLPNVNDLKGVDPTSQMSVQPDWIGKAHPEYVAHDAMHHSLSSERRFQYAGHDVMIRTSYEIEIDGAPVRFHAIVDHEGQLRCHTTPYETYSSASDLVKELIFRFPDSFTDLGDEGGEPQHAHPGMHS